MWGEINDSHMWRDAHICVINSIWKGLWWVSRPYFKCHHPYNDVVGPGLLVSNVKFKCQSVVACRGNLPNSSYKANSLKCRISGPWGPQKSKIQDANMCLDMHVLIYYGACHWKNSRAIWWRWYKGCYQRSLFHKYFWGHLHKCNNAKFFSINSL